MNKKINSAIFMVLATVFSLVLTVGLMLVILILGMLILRVTNSQQNTNLVMVVAMVSFFGSMALSIFLYSKIVPKIVTSKKIAPLLGKRITGMDDQEEKKVEKKKTVLPDSVLPKDKDTWAENIQNSNYAYSQSFGLNELQDSAYKLKAEADATLAQWDAENNGADPLDKNE